MDSKEEYASIEICQLYEVINGEEVYAILDINDRDVMEMLQPFATMMEEYKTVISQYIWNCHVQKHSKILPLPEIATRIWAPVFTEIQQLIEKFYKRSITLKEIDIYLRNISSQDLEHEIQTLVEGCNLCLDKAVSATWVSNFVMSIYYYRDVCKAQSAAQLVLAAKDALLLEGNFEELKQFKSKVHMYLYIHSVSYELMAEYIIAKFSAYSIRNDNRKIPIDCGKCHMKHDVTILLT